MTTENFFSNPLFNTYVFYCSILCLKMLLMSILTGRQRFRKQIFASPEDARTKKSKVGQDEDVERVRRAHLNDLENIPVFMVICAFYLMTGPSAFLATTLIRVFTAARLLHTFVYAIVVIPQPARAIAWASGYFITIFMGVMVLLKFMPFM